MNMLADKDSTMSIWRVSDWACVHILDGHKAGITSVGLHPSGKLTLSVSKDNTLKLWNLVQGECCTKVSIFNLTK